MHSHSPKSFTADKLGKMKASGGVPTTTAARTADEKADDWGKKAAGASDSSQKFKRGGAVHGERAKMRMDRPGHARGGKVKGGKTQINIIMGDKGQQQPQAVPVPMPAPPPPGPPIMPPQRPPMPPPGMMPPGAMPPGAGVPPPMMGRKRGGRVDPMGGSDNDTPLDKPGSGSGEGRLAKARNEAAYARDGG